MSIRLVIREIFQMFVQSASRFNLKYLTNCWFFQYRASILFDAECFKGFIYERCFKQKTTFKSHWKKETWLSYVLCVSSYRKTNHISQIISLWKASFIRLFISLLKPTFDWNNVHIKISTCSVIMFSSYVTQSVYIYRVFQLDGISIWCIYDSVKTFPGKVILRQGTHGSVERTRIIGILLNQDISAWK